MNNNSKAGILINGESHNDLCIGIDLGTTNSVIAIINQKLNGDLVSKVVGVERFIDRMNNASNQNNMARRKENTLPSCVFYDDENNYRPVVGDFAKFQHSLRPHLVAKSIKSQMGNEFAEGLSENVPDKTPAQISSRILDHLLSQASSICKCGKITDAIITVPANFDSSMCQATIEAARLAGIQTKNKDGSDRPILLSEPNAAIYDFVNQMNNGEIPYTVLDISTPKQVMVFDLGGGTLDITMHRIRRRDENQSTLKVDEIATNRYTLLGGDNFDQAIAEEMYRRFLAKPQHRDPSIQRQLERDRESLMPKFISWAENLKQAVNKNNDFSTYDDNWDDDEEEEKFPVGGNTGSNYSYDDDFTRKEVEIILEPFMGVNLKQDDYKRLNEISETNNIIYPILDVLKKASEKLGDDNVKIDAVIMNGGMSRFYMVKQRLETFFGFEPVSLLDPDLAVARGAAVYHYYLHKDAYLQEDMKIVAGSKEPKRYEQPSKKNILQQSENHIIVWGDRILNEALYLGLKGGTATVIVPTGSNLPYDSKVMTGFRLQSGTNRISVPVKTKNLDGSYKTIATGSILFNNSYSVGKYVAFNVHMDMNKVISMTAWTSVDEDCKKRIETGSVEIAIGDKMDEKKGNKIISAKGMPLAPVTSIVTLLQLCKNKESNNSTVRKAASDKLRETEGEILRCGNKNRFSTPILEMLSGIGLSKLQEERLLILSRRIGSEWTSEEKKKLASICINMINRVIPTWNYNGRITNVSEQAIYTLGMCGSTDDFDCLIKLHSNPRFLNPCLHAHGRSRTQLEWVFRQFEKDYEKFKESRDTGNLQFSVYAVGNALRKDGTNFDSGFVEDNIVEAICDILRSDVSKFACYEPCVIALGLICDTRKENPNVSQETFLAVYDLLDNLEEYSYKKNKNIYMVGGGRSIKCRDIAIKMMKGIELDGDEERFLLEKTGMQ